MTLKEYQAKLVRELERVYPNVPIEKEWRTKIGSGFYSPRLDVAVGPFAYNTLQYRTEYDRLMMSNQLVERLLTIHKQNVHSAGWETCSTSFEELKNRNINGRCLLAIEIENSVSRKHLVGGAVNAAALGRIGVVIGWTSEKFHALLKLRKYLNFLGNVGKNTFDTTNLLVLNHEQLLQALEETRIG